MQLIRGIHNLSRLNADALVVTIGNFDGVHLGHRSVLAHLKTKADELNLPTCVVVFEPQPREFFSADNPPIRINSLRDKLTVLKSLQLDYCLCLRFDQKLAHFTAQEFIERILVQGLKVKHITVGDDFKFGYKRGGDFAFLQQQGLKLGFSVTNCASVNLDANRISSTHLRLKLKECDLPAAKEMLGHDFFVTGRVICGQKLAQMLGFPTANVSLPKRKIPLNGVFAVRVLIANQSYFGVANIGTRPTVSDDVRQHLEVHILNFADDIYGQAIKVEFVHKIRCEQKFSDLDTLKKAISSDIKIAKNYFSNN